MAKNKKNNNDNTAYINKLKNECKNVQNKINSYLNDVQDKNRQIEELKGASRKLRDCINSAENAQSKTNHTKQLLGDSPYWKGISKLFTLSLYSNLYNDWGTYISNIQNAKNIIDNKISEIQNDVGWLNIFIGGLANDMERINKQIRDAR